MPTGGVMSAWATPARHRVCAVEKRSMREPSDRQVIGQGGSLWSGYEALSKNQGNVTFLAGLAKPSWPALLAAKERDRLTQRLGYAGEVIAGHEDRLHVQTAGLGQHGCPPC